MKRTTFKNLVVASVGLYSFTLWSEVDSSIEIVVDLYEEVPSSIKEGMKLEEITITEHEEKNTHS